MIEARSTQHSGTGVRSSAARFHSDQSVVLHEVFARCNPEGLGDEPADDEAGSTERYESD
jgi:hypothetical protein